MLKRNKKIPLSINPLVSKAGMVKWAIGEIINIFVTVLIVFVIKHIRLFHLCTRFNDLNDSFACCDLIDNLIEGFAYELYLYPDRI